MTQIFIEARYEKTSEYVFLNTIIKELGFSEAQYKIICVGGNSNLIKAANKYNPQIEMFARFKMKSSFHKTKRII